MAQVASCTSRRTSSRWAQARRLLRASLRWAAGKVAAEVRHVTGSAEVRLAVRQAWLASRKRRYGLKETSRDRKDAFNKLIERQRLRRGMKVTSKRASSSAASAAAPVGFGSSAPRSSATGWGLGGGGGAAPAGARKTGAAEKVTGKVKRTVRRKTAKAKKPSSEPEPSHIFIYGSLRPDDDSGMLWTKRWAEGLEALPAHIDGARLWHGNYAEVTLDGGPDNTVTGYAMGVVPATSAAKRLWETKLKEADDIEGYDPASPDSSFYRRDRCHAITADSVLPAFVYHKVSSRRQTRSPAATG